ncbi:hypothetical protein K439DRAFT_693072 [Ramaria rubella]|nr:hypothetical protein K439DRAFT_693072 [Ramaria rubella]
MKVYKSENPPASPYPFAFYPSTTTVLRTSSILSIPYQLLIIMHSVAVLSVTLAAAQAVLAAPMPKGSSGIGASLAGNAVSAALPVPPPATYCRRSRVSSNVNLAFAVKEGTNAATGSLLQEIESLFKREPGLGSSLAGSAVSGAAGAATGNLLQEIESLFKP